MVVLDRSHPRALDRVERLELLGVQVSVETDKLVSAERLKAAVRAFHEAGEKGLTRHQLIEALGVLGVRAEHRARQALMAAGAAFEERRDPRTREKIFVMTKGPKWDEAISKETRLALRLAAMTLGHGGNSLLERQLETLETITDKNLTARDRRIFENLRKNLRVSGGFSDQHESSQLSVLETILRALFAEIPRQLEITYRAADAPKSKTYLFAPYCLSQDLVSGGTYLLGLKVNEKQVRSLKLCRIEQIKVTNRPVVLLPALEEALRLAADHQFGGFSETIPPFEVVMRVEGAWWIQSMKEAHPDFPGFSMEEESKDTALIRFQSNNCRGLVRWILQFGGDAEVLAPPELIKEVREHVEVLANTYWKKV